MRGAHSCCVQRAYCGGVEGLVGCLRLGMLSRDGVGRAGCAETCWEARTGNITIMQEGVEAISRRLNNKYFCRVVVEEDDLVFKANLQ